MVVLSTNFTEGSSVELSFLEKDGRAIREFFEKELPLKSIEDYDSDEFLEAFLAFLLESKKLSDYGRRVLANLELLDAESGDYFFYGIDGRYGSDCKEDGVIDVHEINDRIYDAVDPDIWSRYKQSNAYLAFLAFLIIIGHKDAVKKKLVKSLPEMGVWYDLFSDEN